MSSLSVAIGVDITGFNKSVQSARLTLEKYKQAAEQSSKSIHDNISVSKEQVTAYERVVKSLEKVASGQMTTTQQTKALKNQIGELKALWANLSDEAKNSDFGKAISSSIKTAEKQLDGLRKQIDSVNESMNTVGKGKPGLGFSGKASLPLDFKGMASQAMSGIVSAAMPGGMAGNVAKGLTASVGAVSGMSAAAATGIGAVVVAAAAMATLIAEGAKSFYQLEDRMANLSAITGITGEGLKDFLRQVRQTGVETSTSFTEIADAYTLVGSKMPELLKYPEALDAVTRAGITLGKAARMDMGEAIESLTGIMNQMGAGAEDANRYINVLAAASKNGAGNIQYLSTAFDKSGTAAATANISVEETAAMIEILAAKIPDASTAGTNLRNILLKMSTGVDEFNPRIVGLQTALDNLAQHENDVAFMTKLFGSENVSAAISLVQARDSAIELTNAITGTNEAEKQAEIQTSSLIAKWNKLSTDWSNMCTSLVADWNTFINGLTNSFPILQKAIDFIDKIVVGFTKYNPIALLNKALGFEKQAAKQSQNMPPAKQADETTNPALSGNSVSTSSSKKGSKQTETAEQRYNRLIAANKASYNENLISANEYFQNEINAIQNYIKSLSENEDSVKKNAKLITELSDRVKTLKNNININNTIDKALQDLDIQTQKLSDGMISLDDYNSKYRQNLQNVIDEFYKLDNITDEQRKAQQEYIKKLKQFDIDMMQYKKDDKQNEVVADQDAQWLRMLHEYSAAILNETPNDFYKQRLEEDYKRMSMTKEYGLGLEQGKAQSAKLGIEFDEAAFERDFYKKYESVLKHAGIEYNEGHLQTDLEILAEHTMKSGGIEQQLIDAQNLGWKGDRTNYGINATSNQLLIDDVIYKEPETDLSKQQAEVERLIDLHKKLQDIIVESSKRDYDAGINPEEDPFIQLNIKELDKLETKIRDISSEINKKLSFQDKVEGIEMFADGVNAIGDSLSTWYEMGDALSNAKNGLEQFLIVFNALIQTFETVNTIMETYNMLQAIFAARKTASAAAIIEETAASDAKIATDSANIASTAAVTVANKAGESSFLDLAAAEIFAAHAAIPFAGVAIAAGFTGTMLGMMAGIHAQTAALSAFANGGIVNSPSKVGDFSLARVNGGEMILNSTQQQRLWQIINGSTPYNAQSASGGNVSFTIEGDKLVGAIKNYGKINPNGVKIF